MSNITPIVTREMIEEEFEGIGRQIELYEKEVSDYAEFLSDRPDFIKSKTHQDEIQGEIKRLQFEAGILLDVLEKKLQDNLKIFTEEENEELLQKLKQKRSQIEHLVNDVNAKLHNLPVLSLLAKIRLTAEEIHQLRKSIDVSQEKALAQQIVDIEDMRDLQTNKIGKEIEELLENHQKRFDSTNKLVQEYARLKNQLFATIVEEDLTNQQKRVLRQYGDEIEEDRKLISDKYHSLKEWSDARKEIHTLLVALANKNQEASQLSESLEKGSSVNNVSKAEEIHREIQTILEKLQDFQNRESTSLRLHEKEKKDLDWKLQFYQDETNLFQNKILTVKNKNKEKEQQKGKIESEFGKFLRLESSFESVVQDYIRRLNALEVINLNTARKMMQKFQTEFEEIDRQYHVMLAQSGLLSTVEKQNLSKTAEIHAMKKKMQNEIAVFNQNLDTYAGNYDMHLNFSENQKAIPKLSQWNAALEVLNSHGEGRLALDKPEVSWRSWIFGGEDKQILRGNDGQPLVEVVVRSRGWFDNANTEIQSARLLKITDESLAILGAMAGQLEQRQGLVPSKSLLVGQNAALLLKARELGESYYQEPIRIFQVRSAPKEASVNTKQIREAFQAIPPVVQPVYERENEGVAPLFFNRLHHDGEEGQDPAPAPNSEKNKKPEV